MCPFINPLLSKEALHQLISKYNTDEKYSEKNTTVQIHRNVQLIHIYVLIT